jgi:hypothetical protein
MTDREGRRTGLAALALFVLTAGFITIKTGRDALYLQGDGLFGLPKAYIATAVLSIPQAAWMLWMLAKLGPRVARVVVMVAVITIVTTYYALAQPGASIAMTTFFFLVPLIFSVAFSIVWLLGTELLEPVADEKKAKAFSRLGAASIVGGLTGGAIARVLGPPLGPRTLLLIGAALVATALAVVIVAHRTFPATLEARMTEDRKMGSLTRTLRFPNVLLLLGIAMAAAMTGIFVDFQFYLGAVGGEDITAYFANVYLVLSGASLALQLFVAPYIQRVIGVRGSLLVLPVALFGGASVVIFVGTVLARSGLRVMEGGLKAGVHRTTWEQAYLTFPKARRAHTKVMVDGLGARIAEGLAGVMLHFWLLFASQGRGFSELSAPWVAAVSAIWVTIALVFSAMVWVLLTAILARRLRREPATAMTDDSLSYLQAPLPDS